MTLNSDERDKLITNTYLFLHLYEKTNTEQKIVNILRCLADGADINATDSQNKNNTPAHIAVQIGDKEILQTLIDNGAKLDQKNSEGKTPHDLAVEIDQIKEIEELLRTFSMHTKLHDEKHSASTSEANKNSPTPFFYEKRDGTVGGLSGHLYETKLVTMVLLRALQDKDITEFHLGSNIGNIGGLDDICLRYVVKGHKKPVFLFLQAKHSGNGRLTVETIKTEAGEYSLLKYFQSYLKIEERFQTKKDPLLVENFTDIDCNFVLYTPVKDDFKRKRNQMNQKSIKLNNIILTRQKGDIFQYDYNNDDITILTKTIVLERSRILAHKLLKLIMSETDNSIKMMADEFIKRYHVALGREVIQVYTDEAIILYNTGKFRPEFFTSTSEFIVGFRESLYLEISRTHCDKTLLAKGEVVDVLEGVRQNPCPDTISKAIGKVVTYNEECNKLEIIQNKKIEHVLGDKLYSTKVSLSNIKLDINIIWKAIMIKLKSIVFKLSTKFGNVDMNLRGDMPKVKYRLGKISEKIVTLLNKNNDTKIIEINDGNVGPKLFFEKGFIDINGGIGGAVGNLLVRDEVTNMFKFDTNNKHLPKQATVFLEELIKRMNKEELESYRINININDFPKYSFDHEKYDIKRHAKYYLDKLWFYTSQANEDEVERIICTEINTHYKKINLASKNSFLFDNHAESIFFQSHNKIQKWWKKPRLVRYLDNTNNFFKEAAKLLVYGSTLLVTLNFMYLKKIIKFNIEFSNETIEKFELYKFPKRLHIVISEANVLSGIKLMQYFEENNAMFLDFDYVLSLPFNDFNDLIKELEFTKTQVLLLMYENPKHNKGLCGKLKQVIEIFGGNTILVSDKILAEKVKKYTGNKYTPVHDTFNFLELTEISQNVIVQETQVLFQGEKVPLKSILNQKAWGLIRGGLLVHILSGETMEVGSLLFERNDTMQRIGAHLVRDATTYNVETINDLTDNPVVVMLNSKVNINCYDLVYNTKKEYSSIWITSLRGWFSEWNLDVDPRTVIDIITAIRIIMLMTFKHDVFNIEELDLTESDGQIIVTNIDKMLNKAFAVALFELELFIYCYNHNHITFIFKVEEFSDTFSNCSRGVYDIKKKKIIVTEKVRDYSRNSYDFQKKFMLIKALNDKGKRIWIDYFQMDNVSGGDSSEIVKRRQKYEAEFGKAYILAGLYKCNAQSKPETL